MCGICGILYYDPSRPVASELMQRMNQVLHHRGPDDSGVWIKGNVGLGHSRLSIIDLSPLGHQPMTNEDGTVWIIFNEVGHAKAVIAGLGPLEEEMKRSIKENHLEQSVIMLGRRTDVFALIKACDIILLTSATEGTPNILLEAQYSGVPVVATKAGGIPEIVENGVSGLLHPVGDIKGMAESVVKILCDKTYARELGQEGHRLMIERFSVDKMANEYLKIYYSNNVSGKMDRNIDH